MIVLHCDTLVSAFAKFDNPFCDVVVVDIDCGGLSDIDDGD